jgi:hypothetical protein
MQELDCRENLSISGRPTQTDSHRMQAQMSTQEYGGPELLRYFEQYYAMLRHIGSIRVLCRTQILVLPKIA